MIKQLKLRGKFVLIFLAIGIIPMLIVSLLNFYYSKEEFKSTIIDGLKAINNSRATNIQHLIAFRQEQAKEFAASGVLKKLSSEADQNTEEVIFEIQKHVDNVFQELKSTYRSRYQQLNQSTDIAIIAVLDINGRVIASTHHSVLGRTLPKDSLDDLNNQGLHFGGYQVDPSTGIKYLLIIDQIRNFPEQQPAGSVIFFVKTDIINEITSSHQGLGDSGETYLVDQERRMLTYSRRKNNKFLNIYVKTQGADACFNNKTISTTYTNYKNENVLGVSQYLPDLEWCLITEMSEDEAFAPILYLRDLAILLAIIFVVIILILARASSRLIVGPILNLNKASKNIAEGNYDNNLLPKSQDELGELTKTFTNMSERLEAARKELITKNQKLTESLKETESKKQDLEKINLELDRYVSTVSHDIGSPITGILSVTEMLELYYFDELDPKVKEAVIIVKDAARHLKTLTDDLLNLTKLSRIDNPFEEVSINAMIDSVRDRLAHDIKSQDVRFNIQNDMPVIVCDRIKISEVLYNLINNAIKFSSKKEGKTLITIGHKFLHGVHEIYVKDNGIGINLDEQEDIFDVFKRLHSSREYDGSGVGLHIVKSIVQEHGGDVRVESKQGEGSTFYITIGKNLTVKK